MLAKVKFSFLSKVFTQRTIQRVSKLYYLQRGYRPNLINSGYFELAKQTVRKCKIPAFQEVSLKNRSVLIDKKKENGIFSVLWEYFLISIRIIVITTVATGLLIFHWITQLFGRQYPIVYLKAIEFLGPTFIKLGQWMSTRRDLYPEEFCACLSRLQRNTSAHSWYYTRHVLEAAYGPNWRQLFVDFEPIPVGSGCCAQVHRASIDLNRLCTDHMNREARASALAEIAEFFYLGYFIDFLDKRLKFNSESKSFSESSRGLMPVAIKILHPRINERLERDLFILRLFTKCLTSLVPSLEWLSITDCINEFSQIMEKQVNLDFEAENLVTFSKHFSDNPEVSFPQPFINLSYSQILVETFHEGNPINDYINENDHELRHKLAKIGLNTVFKMIFEDNFVHCDLHPGNIMVQEKRGLKDFLSDPRNYRIANVYEFLNASWGPRIVILDCGLVTTMSEPCRKNFYDVFRSVADGNGRRAAKLMMEHSVHESNDPIGFEDALDRIVKSHLKKGIKLEHINVGHVMSELFGAMVRYQVKQDGSFSSVILSIAVIEGLGRSLDPGIDLIRELAPFLAATASRFNDL